jgi:hypothetical protein
VGEFVEKVVQEFDPQSGYVFECVGKEGKDEAEEVKRRIIARFSVAGLRLRLHFRPQSWNF